MNLKLLSSILVLTACGPLDVEEEQVPTDSVTSSLQTTPVVQLAPINGEAVGPTPTLSWTPNNGATNYDVWVRDSTGATRQQVFGLTPAELGGCAPCTFNVTVTLNNGIGQWWARPNDIDGNGPWGSGAMFSVGGSAPVTPVNVSTPAEDNQPTFNWDESAGATSYNIWVNDASGFRYNNEYFPACAGTCTQQPFIPLNAGPASVWMRANNAAGSSAWSTRVDFVVPGTAVTARPLNLNATTTPNPTFSWDAVDGAESYFIWVSGSQGFVTNTQVTAASANCSGAARCTRSLGLNLPVGPSTFWVRGANPGAFGPWSARYDFTVMLVAPPVPNGLGGNPNAGVYTWNRTPTATSYGVWVRQGNVSPFYLATHTSGDGMLICNATTCTLQGGAVPPATSPGRFWIRATNAAGTSAWSTPFLF